MGVGTLLNGLNARPFEPRRYPHNRSTVRFIPMNPDEPFAPHFDTSALRRVKSYLHFIDRKSVV